jgi:glycosyltransferase involved in cell wall biosynthesis
VGTDDQSQRGLGVSRASISACIIARDEAEHLPDCLASVAFCDEIVVVDSGSRDATVELARAAGARVVSQPWLGFAAQRNVALDNAHSEWVLEVDADERVSPQLRVEIEAFLAAPPPGIELGGLPLRDVLVGHPLGPSAKYPKYRHRFLRRGAYRHDERRTVHEGLTPIGAVHPFAGDLLHLLAETWAEAVGDAWRYARLEAGQLQGRRTPRAVIMGLLVRPSVKFAYRLSIDGGWRDGPYGLAKIALDCASDVVVWLRYLTGRRGNERGHSGAPESSHYGVRRTHRGTVRVLALAAGPRASAQAGSWLRAAQEAGIDVALISDAPAAAVASGGTSGAGLAGGGAGGRPDSGLAGVGSAAVPRIRELRRMRPIALVRALEAEQQLRTVDVVLPFGPRARALLRLLPRGMRGILTTVNERVEPGTLLQLAEECRNAPMESQA